MNASNLDRLNKAERALIEAMTDEELTAICPDPQPDWITQCTDRELNDILDGKPIPARFAGLPGTED
jgi:hypothetical protein